MTEVQKSELQYQIGLTEVRILQELKSLQEKTGLHVKDISLLTLCAVGQDREELTNVSLTFTR